MLDLRGLAAVDQLIQRQQLLRAGPTLEERSDWSVSRGANPADKTLGSWNTLVRDGGLQRASHVRTNTVQTVYSDTLLPASDNILPCGNFAITGGVTETSAPHLGRCTQNSWKWAARVAGRCCDRYSSASLRRGSYYRPVFSTDVPSSSCSRHLPISHKQISRRCKHRESNSINNRRACFSRWSVQESSAPHIEPERTQLFSSAEH